jgi:hypothetical protein
MESLAGFPERLRLQNDPEFHASLSKRHAKSPLAANFCRRRSHLEEERDAVQCREVSPRARRTIGRNNKFRIRGRCVARGICTARVFRSDTLNHRSCYLGEG